MFQYGSIWFNMFQYGSIIKAMQVTTEGDAFQIAFHDTCDAVAFCLDTQASQRQLFPAPWMCPKKGTPKSTFVSSWIP